MTNSESGEKVFLGEEGTKNDLQFPSSNAQWGDTSHRIVVRGVINLQSDGILAEQTHVRLSRVNDYPSVWRSELDSLALPWSEILSFGVVRASGDICFLSTNKAAFFIKPTGETDRTNWLTALNRQGLRNLGFIGKPSNDYDAKVTTETPPPQSQVSAMVSNKFKGLFTPHLESGESLISVGESLWVQYGLKNGRGSGEGVLAITTLSIVFILNSNGNRLKIPRQDVNKCWKSFIITPRFSEIHFKVNSDEEFSFYATNRMCKEILAMGIT
jgi:hypothetical protein